MTEKLMSQALDAIHEEASKLLKLDHSPEAGEIIRLIISLARYKHDVRTAAEAGRDRPADAETEEDRRRQEILDSDDSGIWTKLS